MFSTGHCKRLAIRETIGVRALGHILIGAVAVGSQGHGSRLEWNADDPKGNHFAMPWRIQTRRKIAFQGFALRQWACGGSAATWTMKNGAIAPSHACRHLSQMSSNDETHASDAIDAYPIFLCRLARVDEIRIRPDALECLT